VIGPGLGRDPILEGYLPKLFEATGDKLLIADADFLHFIVQGTISEELIQKKSSSLIITPNKAEFSRLWDKFIGSK
jgi:NAD(P)H-hydrate repair Nnr-like enzyme with NAD(P)H-hydrate dehydratase domain